MSAAWLYCTEETVAESESRPDTVPPKSPALKPRAHPAGSLPFLALPPREGGELDEELLTTCGQIAARREDDLLDLVDRS